LSHHGHLLNPAIQKVARLPHTRRLHSRRAVTSEANRPEAMLWLNYRLTGDCTAAESVLPGLNRLRGKA
jgi:hypothetical protein